MWPELREKIISFGKKSEQRDVLLLGAFTVLGASLSHVVRCQYGRRQAPCMQTFIVAPSAAGKSALTVSYTHLDVYKRQRLVHLRPVIGAVCIRAVHPNAAARPFCSLHSHRLAAIMLCHRPAGVRYIPQRVEKLRERCDSNGIPAEFILVDSLEKAKALPCVFNNWAVFLSLIHI